MKITRSLRVVFLEYAEKRLKIKTPDGQAISLLCSDTQEKEIDELLPRMREGNILNLLNSRLLNEQTLEAEFIIFEPDYLIDTSTVAECFRPYGNHPLNYSLSRMQLRETTAPILLGNSANFFIDEFVHESEENPAEYGEVIKKLFRTSPFDFTACEELKEQRSETLFFQNCRKHFEQIRQIVYSIFPRAGIDKERIVLEPSFISNQLGLQGRLDILLSDYSAFIELKSGKAVEDFRSGGTFIRSAENHYIQMILYLAILEFNLGLPPDRVSSYLLYSRYPLLSKEQHSRELLREAIFLRNRIVAIEYETANANDPAITFELLNSIDATRLNTRKLTGNFFEQYLKPGIDSFKSRFYLLDRTEQSYFLRLYTFIVRELWLSKAGEREYEGVKKAAVLWNASFEDKLIAGEILYDLIITENRTDTDEHAIVLEIPRYDDLYLPNFRTGDAIVLYERNSDADQLNNRQVFKGSVEELEGNRIKIRLRYRQRNRSIWNESARYAVMHDYMDTTYTGMFRSLTAFMEGNRHRRDLLLGRREPENRECFLLIGPPGTGKTSVSLKKMVVEELQQKSSNLLLLSYTNRAVDEICRTLCDIDRKLPFIRIGSELNCEPQFRQYLLEKRLKGCRNRLDVEEVIRGCRIYVGTVASVWNKPELLRLKRFELAIIDEATQLLEPHLLGLLSLKDAAGGDAIRRFTLIGDYKQLPAVVLQSREDSAVNEIELNGTGLTNLSDSLFERLYRQFVRNGWTEHYDLLTTQGRMHPDICAFPSAHFYENLLTSLGLPHQQEEWPDRKRLHFYDVRPFRQETSEKANRKEAEKVTALCKEIRRQHLLTTGKFDTESVGIITPFRNQIALIRKCLSETEIAELAGITVDTVERFQGSQRDTILYSFCIKTENQLAALPNNLEENGKVIDRKLNVALTRARKELYLIGNRELLEKNELYRKLIGHISPLVPG